MKTLAPTLGSILLASTALVAPQVARAQSAAPEAENQVEEIVILGKNIPEPMRDTAEVASVLTAEDLARSGDDTAAEALTRLTGVSLVGGKFVYVRGLGERYSSALLNGSPLPSPEPMQRVVPLDLFPSNVLESTVVQKTYSPNYQGEFGGGVIDLRTLRTPTEPFFTLGASLGGNSETTGKEGLTYYGSETDWLGYDNGARDIPEPLQRAIETGKRIRVGADFTADNVIYIGSSLVNAPFNLIQRKNEVYPNWSVDVTGGRSFDFEFGTIGVVAVAGYDNSWRTRNGVQELGFVSGGAIAPDTQYAFTSTQNDILVNGMAGLSLDMGDHLFSWTNLYIHSVSKRARIREGYDAAYGGDVRDDYTDWFERNLYSTQLVGEHDIGDDFEVDWRASFAKTTRNTPYEKGIRYREEAGVYYHSASQEQNYTRFGEVEDEVASFAVDGKYHLALSSAREATFSAGLFYLDNERHAIQREFRFRPFNAALPLTVQDDRVDYLLADYNIGVNGLMLEETTGADGTAAYEAGLKNWAAYLQVDAEIIPLVQVSAGVRFEDAEQSVTPKALFAGETPVYAPPPLENQYWLPAATLTWNFAEDMQLRVGASKTIARPQFRELAPLLYLDPDADRTYIGNPNLVDSELLNFDARYEWYFSRDEYVTAGFFAKKIDKPIEMYLINTGSSTVTSFLNAPEATLYGVEFDVKKYFEFETDAPFFSTKRWLVYANYTWSKSELKVSAGDEVYPYTVDGSPRDATDYLTDGDQMQGQSEHLFNLQLGWEDEEAQSQATVLFNYASERVVARDRIGFPDVVQDPGLFVDFTYRKGFTVAERDFTFSFEARNLTDEDYEEGQDLGGGHVDYYQYGIGRSVSFGLSARF
jgi:outer membrane receptor protein involved in Fe transport